MLPKLLVHSSEYDYGVSYRPRVSFPEGSSVLYLTLPNGENKYNLFLQQGATLKTVLVLKAEAKIPMFQVSPIKSFLPIQRIPHSYKAISDGLPHLTFSEFYHKGHFLYHVFLCTAFPTIKTNKILLMVD